MSLQCCFYALFVLLFACYGCCQQRDSRIDIIRELLASMKADRGTIEKREEEYGDETINNIKESISMPGVSPKKHDSYICFGQKVPRDEYYVSFKPKAEMQTAHHMLLFGCETPSEIGKAWLCGEMHPVCGSGGQHILYAWGRNAPPLKLPKDVGFKVGPATKIKYLVLQVHYGKVDKFVGTNLKDYSGVVMEATQKSLRYRAGIFILAEGFAGIPPHEPKWHLDTGCPYQGLADLHPFAVRVHAHKLATVISGYRVRDGKWTLMHKEDPQRPQAFYYLDKPITIKNGDHLEARCTYNSMKKSEFTKIGATMNDEMCNYYIMYYYDPEKYPVEPPGMCSWGGLDDKMKFPKGSDNFGPDIKNPMTKPESPKSSHVYKLVPDWSSENKFGQIGGVAVDQKGFVVVFHRPGRPWDASTFKEDNTLKGNPGPIEHDPLVWLNQTTGKRVFSWGKNMFYLPHGLTVDHAGNLWLTDVGLHQVFKFNLMKSKKPLLTLGIRGVPGSNTRSFCKPTDVAVDRTGVFYVADGYCNSRILMFSAKGQHLKTIGDKALQLSTWLLGPRSLKIPHSVSLDERNQRLYVADRENGRVLVFSALFGNLIDSISGVFGDTVYAIAYKDGYLHAVNGPGADSRGFTLNVKKKEVVSWGAFTRPHDLAISKDGSHLYVGEIGPNKLWKFELQV